MSDLSRIDLAWDGLQKIRLKSASQVFARQTSSRSWCQTRTHGWNWHTQSYRFSYWIPYMWDDLGWVPHEAILAMESMDPSQLVERDCLYILYILYFFKSIFNSILQNEHAIRMQSKHLQKTPCPQKPFNQLPFAACACAAATWKTFISIEEIFDETWMELRGVEKLYLPATLQLILGWCTSIHPPLCEYNFRQPGTVELTDFERCFFSECC